MAHSHPLFGYFQSKAFHRKSFCRHLVNPCATPGLKYTQELVVALLYSLAVGDPVAGLRVVAAALDAHLLEEGEDNSPEVDEHP